MRRGKGFTPLEGPRLAGTQIRIPNRQSGRFLTGFTLIELLVVISIITLLMAVLLPALQRVRNQGRDVVCRANLKQWGTILALYTEDYQGRLPHNHIVALWLLRGSYLRDDDPNKPPLYHDISTKGIACCPMAVRVRSTDTGTGTARGSSSFTSWQIRYTVGSTFEAWEIISPSPPFRGSYGFNEELFDIRPTSGLRPLRGGMDIYSVRGKANVPMLLDCPKWSGRHRVFPWLPPFEGFGMQSFCINRHNGHVNGLFLDWSVRRIGLKELWTLKWDQEFDTANIWTKAGGVQPEDWPQWMRGFKDY